MLSLCSKCSEMSDIELWRKSKETGKWICPKCDNKGVKSIPKKKTQPINNRFEILDL